MTNVVRWGVKGVPGSTSTEFSSDLPRRPAHSLLSGGFTTKPPERGTSMNTIHKHPGFYVLIMYLDRSQSVAFDRKGTQHEFQPGWYVYIGSARLAGGLHARISRHQRRLSDSDVFLGCSCPTRCSALPHVSGFGFHAGTLSRSGSGLAVIDTSKRTYYVVRNTDRTA